MNAYKISYRSPGMDEMMTATVTAPDNRVAERSFKAGFKGSGLPAPDIFHIELVSTNVTATKDQEREALEKIKAIVEALGPDSYIGTALEGCFEIAERNIENDFACSMKQSLLHYSEENDKLRAQVKELEEKLHQEIGEHQDVLTQLRIARGDIENLREALAESEKDYEAAHSAAHEVAEEKDAEIAYLKGKVASLAAKVPSADDLTDCIQMARDSAYGYREKMEEAAASVVELADDPSSPEFTKAVKDHRNAKTAYEYAEALASRLEKIRDNTTAGEQ